MVLLRLSLEQVLLHLSSSCARDSSPLSLPVLTPSLPGSDITPATDNNTVDIPPRSTSQQPGSSALQPPANPENQTEPPSPRRGSKRSLLSRSRQGSRSSRRSARHASKALDEGDNPPAVPQNDSARSERKQKSGGFLAFLNCCRADDGVDGLKSEEPDVPAKQRKIEPTPQRTVIPDEPVAPVVPVAPVASEKMTTQEQPYNEKRAESVAVEDEKPTPIDNPRANARPRVDRNEISHEKPLPVIDPVSVPSTCAPEAAQPAPSTQAQSPRQAEPTVHDLITLPPSHAADTVVTDQKPQLEFPPPPKDVSRESDVDMTDAPPVPPVEEQNVVDEPVQPHDVVPVALPPPPPLQKRIAQTQAPVAATDVPPVPDPEPESKQTWLLPPVQPHHKGRKCLILDLDETLVHSSFKILNQADFTIPVEIEGQYHNVYVIKRPGVDQFMKRVGELYEVVVFTASVSKYGDPLLDQLDIHHVVHHRLFRESCYNHQGNYVKVCITLFSSSAC